MSLHRHAMTSILMRDCPCPTLPALDLQNLSTCQTKIRKYFVSNLAGKRHNPESLPTQIRVVRATVPLRRPPVTLIRNTTRVRLTESANYRRFLPENRFLENRPPGLGLMLELGRG